MTWQLNPPTLLLLLAGLLNLILAINVWPKRHTTIGLTFIVLTSGASLWSFSEFIQLGLASTQARLFWTGVNFIGIGITPAAILVFSLYYTGQSKWVTKRLIAILILINVWQPFAVWTTAQHGLFFYDLSEKLYSLGVLFYVHVGLSYTTILASFIILLALLGRDQQYRRRILLLLTAMSLPIIYNVLFIFRLLPSTIGNSDFTPIAFTASILLLLSSMFQANVLDSLPLAYRELFYHLADPIIVVDQFNYVVDINLSAQKLATRPLNQSLQRPLQVGFPLLTEELIATAETSQSRPKVIWESETAIYTIQINPLRDKRQRLYGNVILLNDVTEQKQVESALWAQYQEMEDMAKAQQLATLEADLANQVKDNFLANMSHELRTPLNAILGYTELVVDEAVDYQYNEILSDLRKIQTSGYHLLDIITRILDLSKIETQRFTIYPEFFPITNLLTELKRELTPLLEKKNNTLQITYDSNLPEAFADERQVYQILVNLLNNSAKFTHNGRITLHIWARKTATQKWIVCQISDNGIGISTDKIETVFQPFAQGDDSHTKAYQGIGVGLTLSHHLCQLMGGRLEIDSVEGSGTTATVYLPTNQTIHQTTRAVEGRKQSALQL